VEDFKLEQSADMLPRPPFSLRESASIAELARSTDPWTVYKVGDDFYLEDRLWIEPPGQDGRPGPERNVHDLIIEAELIKPGAKELWGGRMRRYGVNVPDRTPVSERSPCKYTYVDKPYSECIGAGIAVRTTWKFVVVIRPKSGCEGEPMVKTCTLSSYCWWNERPGQVGYVSTTALRVIGVRGIAARQ